MHEQYDTCFDCITSMYNLLIDAQSRQLFWARLMADFDDESNCLDIFYDQCGKTLQREIQDSLAWVNMLAQQNESVYIYGAKRYGKLIHTYLKKRGIRICAFIDKDYLKIGSCCGLPVLSVDQLCQEPDGYVFIASSRYYHSIVQDLKKCSFQESRILPALFNKSNISDQYFEFMDKMPSNGAFVDGGCYDFATSFAFIERLKSQYSKIIAFEPDEDSYRVCTEQVKSNHVLRTEIIHAGLGKEETQLSFHSNATASRFDKDGTSIVNVVTLDHTLLDRVAFIKLDVEGFELDALIGARQTIQRDKPLCAISVYHKRGDLLAIMQYLSQIVPEYRFAIRHYTSSLMETVLYAFCLTKSNGS